MILEKIDKAFKSDDLAKKVAYMIATSHEYKKPNQDAAIKLVSNYKWEKRIMKVSDLQGINKPINKEKVYDIAKTLNPKTAEPLMVVNKFQGITPQTPGKKILLDGHHRKEAYEFLGIKEIPVYYGKYTGGSEKSINELIDKKAEEILGSLDKTIYYHASPVQGIKKFRLSEDTSGNNKGKVLFASKYPNFSAAFGIRWNDGTARLQVNTSDSLRPTKKNYEGSILQYTDVVDLEQPCSMYRIRGNFRGLRYPDDVEVITNSPDIEIVSEERFSSFRDMAKAYDLKLQKVSNDYILNKLKSHKTSNFEKKANIFTKKDLHKTGFPKNNNLEFVTGFSGSGKSTYCDARPDIHIELDGLEHGYDSSEIGLVDNYLKNNSKITKENYNTEVPKAIEYFKEIARKNKDKKYTVDGIQLLDFPHSMDGYPVTIKGTGLIKSCYRANKRNAGSVPLKTLIKNELKDNKKINAIRKYIEKRASSYSDEIERMAGEIREINTYKNVIEKQAAINDDVKYNPIQQRVLDNPSSNMILAHPVGSGKTLSGIAKFEKLKSEGKASKALVILE